MAVTVSDVEQLSSTGFSQLSQGRKDALLADAQREAETIYSGRMSRTPTLDGDQDVFIKNLAAHKYELAEGGQAENENAQGGSASYTTGGSVDGYLDLTRFGRTAKRHIRNEESISIVRSY